MVLSLSNTENYWGFQGYSPFQKCETAVSMDSKTAVSEDSGTVVSVHSETDFSSKPWFSVKNCSFQQK